MRLSATDRIIRDAEQHDSAVVQAEDGHPDTEKVAGAPLLSLGFPSPRMPTPLGGGVDVLFDDEDDDEGEEGETQVDAKRSAAALDQMRALQEGGLTPPPALARRSGVHRGLPHGRPGGTVTGLTPTLAPLASDMSPHSTLLLFGPAAARVAPVAQAPERSLPSIHQPARQVEDSRLDPPYSPSPQLHAVATPLPSLPQVASPPRSGVGRRTGFAIAAGTALAVTVIVGVWSARGTAPTPLLSPDVIPALAAGSSRSVADEPAAPSAAVPPAAVPAPADAPVIPVPAAETAPAAETVPAAAPSLAAPGEGSITVPAPTSKRAQAAAKSLKVAKARLSRKRALSSKRNVRAVRPTRTVGGPGAPTGRPASANASASHGHADPDDTLPISD